MRAMQWRVCVCQLIVKQKREQKKSSWYECAVTDKKTCIKIIKYSESICMY